MKPGKADLLLDQIEIVEQPLAGRRHAASGFDRFRQQPGCLDQYLFVVGQSRQQAIRAACVRIPMHASEKLAVLFHLVAAEQLRPQRRLARIRQVSRPRPASRFPFVSYVSGNHEKLALRLRRSAA
jgi:hypothetical protein